jgi:hypothetical protein
LNATLLKYPPACLTIKSGVIAYDVICRVSELTLPSTVEFLCDVTLVFNVIRCTVGCLIQNPRTGRLFIYVQSDTFLKTVLIF